MVELGLGTYQRCTSGLAGLTPGVSTFGGNLVLLNDPLSKDSFLCLKPFQADGWCDTINNRAYCQYDGGDCCSSTLSSRKVSEHPLRCWPGFRSKW